MQLSKSAPDFVLDGSVTIAWGLDDEASIYADQLLTHMSELHAHVPSIWKLEVANALLVSERRKRIKQAKVAHFSIYFR